jgi:hypothetical protein
MKEQKKQSTASKRKLKWVEITQPEKKTARDLIKGSPMRRNRQYNSHRSIPSIQALVGGDRTSSFSTTTVRSTVHSYTNDGLHRKKENPEGKKGGRGNRVKLPQVKTSDCLSSLDPKKVHDNKYVFNCYVFESCIQDDDTEIEKIHNK